MQDAKATVRAILDDLPDDCSLADVAYRIHLHQAIEASLEDVDAGRVVPHRRALRELRARWANPEE